MNIQPGVYCSVIEFSAPVMRTPSGDPISIEGEDWYIELVTEVEIFGHLFDIDWESYVITTLDNEGVRQYRIFGRSGNSIHFDPIRLR